MIPTLFGVAMLVFIMLRVIPGDVVELRYSATAGRSPRSIIEQERARLGLDQPIWRQFVDVDVGRGAPGLRHLDVDRRADLEEIALRFALSLAGGDHGHLVAVLLAIPLGTLAALKQDTWIDYAVRIFSIAGLAMPSFWLGIADHPRRCSIVLQAGCRRSIYTPFWVEPVGRTSPSSSGRRWPSAIATRGGDPHDALGDARGAARGLHPHRARQGRCAEADRHRATRCKNAMLPVVTVIGIEFAFLIGGLVVTEQVFNLNGIGMLFVQAVAHRDYTLIQALVMLVARVLRGRQFPGRPRCTPGSIRASGTADDGASTSRS